MIVGAFPLARFQLDSVRVAQEIPAVLVDRDRSQFRLSGSLSATGISAGPVSNSHDR